MSLNSTVDTLIKWVVVIGLAGLIALCLTSCNRELRSQKKLKKLIAKYPELVEKDTLLFIDTVVTSKVSKDTIFYYSKDTVIIKEKNLTVKYFERSDGSKYLKGECDRDTIYIREKIPYDRIVNKELTLWEKYKEMILLLLALIILFALLRKMKVV